MHHGTAAATAATLLTTALTLAPTATAAPPRAVVVPCGAVLTSSVRLAADVDCPGGNGITLAADGIELNLNGHAFTGPGAAPGERRDVGVRVRAQDVVVRNGTVGGWSIGVLAGTDPYEEDEEGPVSAVVRQARLEGNSSGVEVRREGDVEVRSTWFIGNGLGGYALTGGRLLVEHSTADRNGSGFASFEVDRDGLVVRDTAVRGSSGAGVACGTDGRAVLERTTLQRNGVGLDAFLCSARVSDSAFVWNGRHTSAYLVDRDTVEVTCTTFTRDGGPLTFETEPCATGGAGVSGTMLPWETAPR
ncbi:right-handed parallel beta-helix repeat-containing protein [Kineococcus sp. SYSU DK018]|uniref:right-handed parallel beta-helix repeat-containing protein n=1 Tax=Kineococcus sp. SYSU DK018 TaxID=3383139 RepID=UPI003D7E1011